MSPCIGSFRSVRRSGYWQSGTSVNSTIPVDVFSPGAGHILHHRAVLTGYILRRWNTSKRDVTEDFAGNGCAANPFGSAMLTATAWTARSGIRGPARKRAMR
jgi:hypothetical protein